ncbi:MAG: (2Fe-2S)-binding protein [Planctomycetota bacterium]
MGAPCGDSLICRCYRVPEAAVRQAIVSHGLRQVEEVTAVTKAGAGCSSCWDDIQRVLSEIWGAPPPRDVPDGSGLTGAQKRARILEVIEGDVRPLLGPNDLDMQLVDVTGDRVLVRFTGSRAETPAPSFLAVKRFLVQKMSAACGQKMVLVELNVLEEMGRRRAP